MKFDHLKYRNRRNSDSELTEQELAFYSEVLKNSKDIIPGFTVTNSGGDFRPGFMGMRQALEVLDHYELTVGLSDNQKILMAACELGIQHINWERREQLRGELG